MSNRARESVEDNYNAQNTFCVLVYAVHVRSCAALTHQATRVYVELVGSEVDPDALESTNVDGYPLNSMQPPNLPCACHAGVPEKVRGF